MNILQFVTLIRAVWDCPKRKSFSLKTGFYYNFFGDEMTKGMKWMKEMISNMQCFIEHLAKQFPYCDENANFAHYWPKNTSKE